MDKITLEELDRRGMDNRMQEVLFLMFGERISEEALERVSPQEAWAFRFGPLCECGERGLSPDEVRRRRCDLCRSPQP